MAALEQLVAEHRVLLHHRELVGVEPPGLEQDAVRDADLADVVHRRGLQQQLLLVCRQAQVGRDQLGVMRHAQDVGAGFGVAEFGRLAQAQHGVALARQDFRRGLAHFVGQPFGAVGECVARRAERQHVLRACQELHFVHWLGQEVVGANVQRPVAHLLLVVGGDHQDRHMLAARQDAQALDEFQAVDVRHHVVDDDQVRRVGGGPGQPFQRVGKAVRLAVVELLDQCTKQDQVDVRIVDDQNALGHGFTFAGLRLMPGA